MSRGISIKIEGIEELQGKLDTKSTLEDVKMVVKQNGAKLQQRAMKNAPVDTGTLKRSIKLDIQDFGFTAIVEPTAHYAPYVEYGTRFMFAQPFLRPALDYVKADFSADLNRLLRK